MSKQAFNGQSDAPAAPQGFNQAVNDNPAHGKAIQHEASPNKEAKASNDIRPKQAQTPAEHSDREGATEHSGFQPATKFAKQGSLPYSNEAALKAPTRSGLRK